MPFIEVIGFDQPSSTRAALAESLTEAVTSSYGVGRDIVTIYFHPVPPTHYAHAGRLAPGSEGRTFVKLHAYPRPQELKALCAERLCRAFVEAGAQAEDVITYFFERPAHDVAHAGRLSST